VGDTFSVYYLYRGEEKFLDFDEWLAVILFLDETENFEGGFAYMIYLNGEIRYIRILDHENGTDAWLNMEGDEVNLEQEFRSTI
jgi:hypothetical protein